MDYRRIAIQKWHRTRMDKWNFTVVMSRRMRLSMHVAHNKCICRSTMGSSAILWEMALQAVSWHPGAGIGDFLASQFNRALENAAEISRLCTRR